MPKRYQYRHMIEAGDGRTLDDGQPNTYITEERSRTWVTRAKEHRSEYWIREFTLYGYLRRDPPRKWTRIDSPLVGDWREGAFVSTLENRPIASVLPPIGSTLAPSK